MAGEYQFSLIDVTKQQGTKTILKDVNLSFFYGAHIGVIGANGAGKSSLLKILAGLDTELMGTVQVAKGTKVGYLPQEPELDDSKTVLETVMEGVADAQAMVTRYEDLCCELDDPKKAAEMERLQEIIDANDYWNLENLVERRMADLGCPDGSKRVGVLSGGERRRVAIARLLLTNPDVLLLDEPTNHLDAETTFRLEAYLKDFKGTLIVVTHDRYFLSDVTDWILELDHGICYPYKGNYEEWLKQKEAMLAREAKVEKSRQKLLENELKWIQTNPSGRHAKAKARVERYEELQKQEVSTREDDLVIRIPPGPRLGDLVVRAEHVKMSFDGQVLYDDLNFDLPRGGIVGVIGANGAGKTTLFRLITGQLKPDAGSLRVGDTVKLSYVDQTRSELKPDETVYEAITGGASSRRRSACSPAASATACTSRSSSRAAATCFSSTSPRTTSTSRLSGRWKRASRSSAAASWSSRTTAGSSTASRRTSSPSRARAALPGSRAATASTTPTCSRCADAG